MREIVVEKYLINRVENRGGICLKFVSPGLRGVPDRIVLLPDGVLHFIEMKAPGEKPSKQQLYRMSQFRALGFKCEIVDSKRAVDDFIEEALNEYN